MLKAGIIGFGTIAKAHRKGYVNLEKEGKVKLVCACDIDPEAINRKIEAYVDSEQVELKENLNFYTDLEEMLEKESVDFIDICLPTFLHKEFAVKLLRRGYHVLSEKPMALNYEDCKEMLLAAKESGKELMIAQCLRFYPDYEYLKESITDNRFGKVIGAFFTRFNAPPKSNYNNWFMSPERSGGCLTDLHIHDIDMARYLFGEPTAVNCRASTSVCLYDTVHTALHYEGFPVTAIGDWSMTGMPFKAGFQLDFEKATVVRNPGAITVYPKDGSESYDVQLSSVSGYQAEISFFCDVIEGKVKNTKNTATGSSITIKLIEALRESAAASGKTVEFNPED